MLPLCPLQRVHPQTFVARARTAFVSLGVKTENVSICSPAAEFTVEKVDEFTLPPKDVFIWRLQNMVSRIELMRRTTSGPSSSEL
jgi:hypothetical protein